MLKLIVKNGNVFDPMNAVNGEKKDILIEDGRIVDKFSNSQDIKEIDASNKTVIPAAIDIHAHIASQSMNWVRLLGSKNSVVQDYWQNLSLDHIAKQYISNGYTFIVEANVFPSLAKHTMFNLRHLPVLDKVVLLNISNLWPLELEYQKGLEDDAGLFLSNLLEKTKSFGFKIYNPFEAESWNFQKVRESLEFKGRLYNFTPMDVYINSIKFNEHLGLPHSIQAHIEGYEQTQGQKNLLKILDKIITLELTPPASGRNQIFHLAHASSYNVDGDNSNLISFFNQHQNCELDLGFIGFDPINPLVTGDRRLINSLSINENPFPLLHSAIESEGDLFATFRRFDKQKKFDCIIWANAIDLALNIENKWQMQVTFNYPNYANVSDISEIATWLISNKARDEFMKEMNSEFLKDAPLISNDSNLSFYDFVVITRSSPANSLGLKKIKGNLGAGADADLNILNVNITEVDPISQFGKIKKSLDEIDYVIKGGEIVKNQDTLNMNSNGAIFWTKGNPKKEDTSNLVLRKKNEFYQKYYSVFYDTLEVSIEEKHLRKIE